MSDTYTVRGYEPDDRDGFRALFETVFDHSFSEEAFEWKFERNPYVSHVPILIAETGGEVVGARAFLPRRIRAGDRTILAFEGTDAMVHPDHRQQGIYARLVERTAEYYAENEAVLRFPFPNRVSLPGNLKHGARLVGTVPAYYRLQNPAALLDSPNGALRTRLARRLGTPLVRGYLDVRERLRPEPTAAMTVRRHAEIPAVELGALYERSVPERLHVVRDAEFYRWRFDNPEWDYTAYTAVQGNRLVGGMVVGTQHMDGATVTRLTDVLPMGRGARTPALVALLETVIGEHEASDMIAAFGNSAPPALLSDYGFLSNHRPPLSWVSTATPMVVSLLSPESEPDRSEWEINGFDPTNEANWLLSYSDWDAA